MPESSCRQRIGIFGGTFDPIHVGHLLLAERCREQLQLDQVRFVPAAVSPLKQDQESSVAKHRLEMVRLAISGHPDFVADDRELRRGGTSYTVDTLADMAESFPNDELVFLMGADSLASLDAWRSPEEICRLAFVAVLSRGGQPAPDMGQLAKYLPDDQRASVAEHLIAMPQIEISSTDIRQRVSSARSTRFMLHPTTTAYIAATGQYGSQDGSE